MFLASFSAALGAVFNALYLVAGVYVYVSLMRQIAARASVGPPTLEPPARTFGLAEAVLAAALVVWFLLNVVASLYVEPRHLSMRDIVVELFFRIGMLLFMVAFLTFRRFDLTALGGFSKIGFWRILGTGVVLLLAAYPLIALADALMQRILGGGANLTRQQIVDLFSGSETIGQRVVIIFLAVVVAPIAEEFIFRFFLYGVLKRYFGWFLGVAFNSLLFAAVHNHLPSFAALFVLGCCFTIAYEWSGSILVSMTMHALFNSITLTLLAFPEIFPQ
jgi:membrane protease YdiL (CAAX protease family)